VPAPGPGGRSVPDSRKVTPVPKAASPCVRQAFAAQDTQKRCFAGAVCTDNADAVAALDPGVDVLQDFVFTKAFAQVLQFQQHGGVSSLFLYRFHNDAAALCKRQRHTA